MSKRIQVVLVALVGAVASFELSGLAIESAREDRVARQVAPAASDPLPEQRLLEEALGIAVPDFAEGPEQVVLEDLAQREQEQWVLEPQELSSLDEQAQLRATWRGLAPRLEGAYAAGDAPAIGPTPTQATGIAEQLQGSGVDPVDAAIDPKLLGERLIEELLVKLGPRVAHLLEQLAVAESFDVMLVQELGGLSSDEARNTYARVQRLAFAQGTADYTFFDLETRTQLNLRLLRRDPTGYLAAHEAVRHNLRTQRGSLGHDHQQRLDLYHGFFLEPELAYERVRERCAHDRRVQRWGLCDLRLQLLEQALDYLRLLGPKQVTAVEFARLERAAAEERERLEEVRRR